MSAAAWKAENKNNPNKAVMVGNVAVPAGQQEPQNPVGAKAAGGGLGMAAAVAPPVVAEKEEEEFTGRHTKVLPPVATCCVSRPEDAWLCAFQPHSSSHVWLQNTPLIYVFLAASLAEGLVPWGRIHVYVCG